MTKSVVQNYNDIVVQYYAVAQGPTKAFYYLSWMKDSQFSIFMELKIESNFHEHAFIDLSLVGCNLLRG